MTKGDLWRCQRAIEERLAGLRLTLHPGAHPRPVAEGVPFLGFHLFPERRRLKRRKGVHFQRRLQAQLGAFGRGDLSAERLAACIDGWVNHIRYGNTVGLREAVLGDVPPEVRALLHCESLARSRAGHSPRQTPKRKAGAQLGTMALAASVTGRLAPLLPYLVKGGDKGAVEEVAKTLEDTAQRDVLQGQLRKVLDEDEALARDLQRLLDEVGQPTGGVQVEVRGAVAVGEHATAAGKGSIVIGAGVRGEVHQGQRKKDDDG
jgi:hypothetical protein